MRLVQQYNERKRVTNTHLMTETLTLFSARFWVKEKIKDKEDRTKITQ